MPEIKGASNEFVRTEAWLALAWDCFIAYSLLCMRELLVSMAGGSLMESRSRLMR